MSIRGYRVSDPIEQRLLDAVTANPSDPIHRSVYADWLESVGGFAHAEFLRTQLAMTAAEDAADPEFQAASARLAELAMRLEPGWRARVAIAFVEACPPEVARRRMIGITVARGGADVRRVVFEKVEITIGRAPHSHLVLDADGVDNRHARIVIKDGRFIVVDMRSTTGTHVNGRRLTSPLVVRPGDAISIGEFALALDRPGVNERANLAMELVCPRRWDCLTPTAAADVRHCDACRRDVQFCTTVDQARHVANAGGCVAIDPQGPERTPGDLEQRPRVMMMGRPVSNREPVRPTTPRPPPPRPGDDDFEVEDPTTPQAQRFDP